MVEKSENTWRDDKVLFFWKKKLKNASHEMNNNPGVFTEDMPLNKKLFLFIFLLTVCFQKNILRHDYLLADEVI